MIPRAICLVIGYIFGCFSTGYIIGKLNHIDIRNYGSGNSGTTNALRTLGVKAGILTLLGDALKAIVPMLFLRFFSSASAEELPLLLLYTGLGVVLGHNFPVWLKFRGGKGIAATAGVMFAFDLRFGIAAFIVFTSLVLITRYVSLGSLVIALIFPIGVYIFYSGDIHMLFISGIFTVLAYIKHWGNIIRLVHGTERKLGQKEQINK